MGNPSKKKKQSSSEDSSGSSSDSDSSSNSEKKVENEHKGKANKVIRKPSISSENEEVKKPDPAKPNDRVKKHKFEDAQKSKWDSPAENVNRNYDRRQESRVRRYSDREPRKHDRFRSDRGNDRGNERREDNRRRKDNRFENKDQRGGRYDRRQNEDRYRENDRHQEEDRYRDNRRRSRSREDNRRDNRDDSRPRGNKRFDNSGENENYDWGKKGSDDKKKTAVDKEKPNFGLSGKLTEDTNTFKGVVIKYSEPQEARKPKRRWRLYPFKGEKALPTLYVHRESAYLMGRDRKVVDFPLDHPSCSKQHAVLQYRLVPFTRDDGSTGKRIRPYIIDLDSANGTFINNKQIDPRKYVELLEKDVIKFGYSSREYVLLHENSKDEGMDDDVKQEEIQEEIPVKDEPQD